MAHYDIFRQELAIQYPGYGHALWEPSPGVLYPPVEIGDVGFIREGQFHRLFNALLPADHPSHQNFGVPEYYEPLQLNMQQHIVPRILSPNNFCSSEVTVTSGGQGVFAPGPEPEQISFSCSRQGAILSLPVPARRLETVAKGVFGKWIVNHIDRWFAFTQRLGLGITRMEDILLVTGCDLTRSWANIAFLQGRGEARVSFGVQVNGAPNIEWQFPPEERQGVALNLGPNGQNLPEDQCIFIRGFRVTRLLGILPRLRGAAGPSQNPDQDPDEPELDMQLLNLSADSNYQDPLHKLLGYIAMKAPDCDMVLVHDDDLMRVDNAPNTVMGRPRKSMPEVWQVQCGGSEAKTPILNVATLSKNPFGAPANFSQPLGVPASNLPSPSDIARDLFLPSPTDIHADRGAVGPLTTPLREPGQSSHEPQDDNTKTQPMKRTKSSRSTRKYDAATKAQFEDQGTSLRLELPRKDIGLTHPVKTLHDRGQRMPPVSAAGHMERSLLRKDATTKDKVGLTPLHRALCQGLTRVALTLLELGADATAPDNEGRTPLHWASPEGHLEVIRALLDRGADAAAQDKYGRTPLQQALSHGHEEVAVVLLEHGADATARNDDGGTPLHQASLQGHTRATRALLDRGADTAAQDKYGRTPLHRALSYGHEEIALVLLEHGADATARNDDGDTPLHQASLQGRMRTTRALLDRGADTEAQDKYGRTPLHLALLHSHEEIALVLLIEHGADATARDNQGKTPLHWASSYADMGVIRALLDRGADVRAQDNDGNTPCLHQLSSADIALYADRKAKAKGVMK